MLLLSRTEQNLSESIPRAPFTFVTLFCTGISLTCTSVNRDRKDLNCSFSRLQSDIIISLLILKLINLSSNSSILFNFCLANQFKISNMHLFHNFFIDFFNHTFANPLISFDLIFTQLLVDFYSLFQFCRGIFGIFQIAFFIIKKRNQNKFSRIIYFYL